MRCSGCGFCITVNQKSVNWKCNVCGGGMLLDAEDFLLHQYGAPGRDVRPEQVKMGVLVEEVLFNQEIALIEAPVGSGKSDGYGIPAFIAASDKSKYKLLPTTRVSSTLAKDTKLKRRIVISTAKKNLQHQIAEKDLPFIKERHGGDARIALFKGKSNYACRFRVDMLKDPDKEKMHRWLDKNPAEDLTQYPGQKPIYFPDITAEECIGKSCAYAQSLGGKPPLCGYRRARQAAKDAAIVVTNHHVVAQDLKLGPNRLLGSYTALIIDEAHQLPGSLRAAFSEHITQGAPNKLARLIDKVSLAGSFAGTLKSQWDAMFANVQASQGELKRDPFGRPAADAVATLSELWDVTTKQAVEFGWVADPKEGEEDSPVSKLSDDEKLLLSSFLSIRKRCESLTSALRSAAEPDSNTVIFVTQEKQQRVVSVCPVNTGPLVGPRLQLIPSIVLTSGTITLNGSFNEIKYQLGLNWSAYAEGATKHPAKKINELILKNPFDYSRQAFLYTPTHMPMPVGETSPNRGAYISAVVDECARLIEASNGNAFVLFTAKKDQEDVYAGLLGKGLTQPLILHAGDAEVALQQFKNTPNSALLGLKSFWEGVDIQGQKLQLVIIPKLPFASPTDPVVRARTDQCIRELLAEGVDEKDASKTAFRRIQIPQMLIDLRQGAGRLIRTKRDRGVLAILDPRIFTGSASIMPRPNHSPSGRYGYGKEAADAIGFNNQTIDFELIAKGLRSWNK